MSKYQYTVCLHIYKDDEWINTEVGCEECGSHSAKECPNCGEVYDSVWDGREEIEE